MTKTKLAVAIDSLWLTIIIFLTSFFIVRRFIKNAFSLCFVCILLSICSFFLIFKFFIKQYNLKNISIKDQNLLNKSLKYLKFLKFKDYISFFQKLLNAKLFKENILENENYFFYLNLRESLDESDFFVALDLQHMHKKKVVFICENFSLEFKNLIEEHPDKFLTFTATDVFLLMKKQELFPIEPDAKTSTSQNLKIKFSKFLNTLTKRNFKDYFFSGLSLVAFSFFLPFSFYYSILGIFLLSLSIICLFKSKSNNLIIKQTKISLIDTIKK